MISLARELSAYLEACIEESDGDAAFIVKALGNIARAEPFHSPQLTNGYDRPGDFSRREREERLLPQDV